MKKSPNHIDQIFQSHFDEHEISVIRSDQLWSRVAPQKDDNRKGLIILFFLAIGIATAFQLNPFNINSTQTANKSKAFPFTNSSQSKNNTPSEFNNNQQNSPQQIVSLNLTRYNSEEAHTPSKESKNQKEEIIQSDLSSSAFNSNINTPALSVENTSNPTFNNQYIEPSQEKYIDDHLSTKSLVEQTTLTYP